VPEARTGIGVAILTAAATLIGAAAGVAGTLVVSQQQTSMALAAEQRTVRAEVYQAYIDAAAAFQHEQMVYAVHPLDHCLIDDKAMGVPTRGPFCFQFNTDQITGPAQAAEQARRRVLIYGSPDGVQATRSMDDFLAFRSDPSIAPFSRPIIKVWMAYADPSQTAEQREAVWNEAWDNFGQREAALLLVMCQEVSASPSDCSEFAKEAGTLPSPAPSATAQG
jgi:hypothetical protein